VHHLRAFASDRVRSEYARADGLPDCRGEIHRIARPIRNLAGSVANATPIGHLQSRTRNTSNSSGKEQPDSHRDTAPLAGGKLYRYPSQRAVPVSAKQVLGWIGDAVTIDP
jgi:hypothetical protein